jgi:hypothetical protein
MRISDNRLNDNDVSAERFFRHGVDVRQPPAQKDMALLHLPISQGLESSSSWCLLGASVVAVYNFDSQSTCYTSRCGRRSNGETPRLFPRASCLCTVQLTNPCTCLPLTPISLGTGRIDQGMLPILGDANMHDESGKSGHLPEPACMHVFLPTYPSTHDHHDVAFVDSLFRSGVPI